MGIKSTAVLLEPGFGGSTAYLPGDTMRGTVVLQVTGHKPHRLSAVCVKMRGRAKTHWTTESGTGDSKTTTTHSETQWFFRRDIALDQGAETSLLAGTHHLPFSFRLPDRLPPTQKCSYGRVEYFCKARANSSSFWQLNGRLEVKFVVAPRLDLNYSPELASMVTLQGHDSGGLFSSALGKYRVTMDKQGYVAGEQIRIGIHGSEQLFEHMSKSNGVVKLKRVTLCRAGSSTKNSKVVVAAVRPGTRPADWRHVTLTVPGGELTVTADVCRIMTTSYFVKIKSRRVELRLPVVVGSVPFPPS